jgi:hypothetical protein
VIVGALWVGLMMAVAGDPATAAPAAPPPAAASFVAVMQPPADDAVLVETASRICSELAASGLEGRLVDCARREADGIPCPDAAGHETISLERQDGVVEINVRVIATDGLELGRHVRVMSRDGGGDASVLAVRAVELLRDVRLNAQRPAPPGPRQSARDDEEPRLPPPPPVPTRWLLTTGGTMLGAPAGKQQGVGPSLGLAFGAGAIIGPHLVILATFAGPFDNLLGSVDAGNASLTQILTTLELRYRFLPGPLQPFAALFSGANYLRASVSGTAISTSAWVPLFGAGGGFSQEISNRFTASLEVDAFVTDPDMLVYVDGQIVGRTGAPSLLVTASAGLILP